MMSTAGVERRSAVAAIHVRKLAFIIASAVVFVASVVTTIVWCTSMSAMSEMPMPGGWTMSMTWMRMPGQTWAGAATSFLGMWIVMMVAMMLPSLMPMLSRYREAVCLASGSRLGRLTVLVGVGYFIVWALFGAAAFLLGVGVTSLEMHHPSIARAVPVTVGVVVLITGALQFTPWKARQLVCCREASASACVDISVSSAWRHGFHFGLQCGPCCANLMVILLAVGVMDLRAMAVVTVAITAERLGPADAHIARAIGAVVISAGVLLIARATGLG